MWILILTIVAGGHSAPAVVQAGPFETRELCMQAATAWLKKEHGRDVYRHALCARTTLGKGESQ
jgi:hypothetical protein